MDILRKDDIWAKVPQGYYTGNFDFERHYVVEAHLAQCRASRALFAKLSERSQDVALNAHVWDAVFFDCFDDGYIAPIRYNVIKRTPYDGTERTRVDPPKPLATKLAYLIYH